MSISPVPFSNYPLGCGGNSTHTLIQQVISVNNHETNAKFLCKILEFRFRENPHEKMVKAKYLCQNICMRNCKTGSDFFGELFPKAIMII